jgi:mRNA-degrading endonuclease YafQ of YafQ-DinJ toxin-antitoxin module
MVNIVYTPSFVRQFKNLPKDLMEEVYEKINLFKNEKNHKALKVHKLKGRLSGRYGFSVNYKYRIVFIFTTKKEATFLAIGDHDIYK